VHWKFQQLGAINSAVPVPRLTAVASETDAIYTVLPPGDSNLRPLIEMHARRRRRRREIFNVHNVLHYKPSRTAAAAASSIIYINLINPINLTLPWLNIHLARGCRQSNLTHQPPYTKIWCIFVKLFWIGLSLQGTGLSPQGYHHYRAICMPWKYQLSSCMLVAPLLQPFKIPAYTFMQSLFI